jgi:hypothetical protein
MKTTGTDDASKIGQTVHAFELAGLGKAPFRFLGVRENAHTIPGTTINKPGGSCDYCLESIRWEYRIQSADGKTFKVGCDCVAKVGDAGLRRYVDAARRNVERKQRAARAAKKASSVDSEIAALMTDPAVTEKLASLPHPRGYSDRETGRALTMLDQVTWMLENAGRAGKAKTLAAIKAAIAA